MSRYSGNRRAMAARDARGEAIKRYNSEVLNQLNGLDKDAALTLNRRGSELGLWTTADFCRLNGQSPTAAAVNIARQLEGVAAR